MNAWNPPDPTDRIQEDDMTALDELKKAPYSTSDDELIHLCARVVAEEIGVDQELVYSLAAFVRGHSEDISDAVPLTKLARLLEEEDDERD